MLSLIPISGKGLPYGGSLARTEATGYGLAYLMEEMLKTVKGESLAGKRVVVSGSGNVAIYANEKATQLGAKVVAMCDSNGWIYDEDGVDLKTCLLYTSCRRRVRACAQCAHTRRRRAAIR